MKRLHFDILADGGPQTRARLGRVRTARLDFETPLFMPVATLGTVRAQLTESLKEEGFPVLLSNTFHLLLRPGTQVLKQFGGYRNFMKWDGGILTDSGGFQVFSLAEDRRMTEDGAVFRSFVDGSLVHLTPELSLQTQAIIGSDIRMAFDECVPSTVERSRVELALERTHRWAERSLAARGEDDPAALLGIVQGACDPDLRRQSAKAITSLPFDAFALGGLAVGESRQQREDTVELAADLLPQNLPRYLMGVGTPIDLVEAVHRGVDMFDCILPSSIAQHGVAYTFRGRVRMRRGPYKFDENPIDPKCQCPTCSKYSRAFIHHLLKAEEPLAWTLIGRHNFHFYKQLILKMRERIRNQTFESFVREARDTLTVDDPDAPPLVNPPPKTIPPPTLGNFKLEGSRMRDIVSGEIMHPGGPEESYNLYVEPSQLAKRLARPSSEPLVIWDVGLGIATNAMAIIHTALKTTPLQRPLVIASFEFDFDALKLALLKSSRFPHLWHPAPHAIFKDDQWTSADGMIQWRLYRGDFLNTYKHAASPDLVFHDPFSPKVNAPVWSELCFQNIRQSAQGKATELRTYSSAVGPRIHLLKSGFWVGNGVPTDRGKETTVAWIPTPDAHEIPPNTTLLDQSFLTRVEQSPDFSAELSWLRGHPQFAL